MTELAILLSAILVSGSIIYLARVIVAGIEHFDGVANLFFAVSSMQLRVELDELGYECPEWLRDDFDDDEEVTMPTPGNLRLVKLEKDKSEE